MLISTFEYHALFGDKPKEKISNEDIIKECSKRSKLPLYDDSSNFYTWQQHEIISDEYGNTKIEIVTKTGFENEGSWLYIKFML